MRKEIGKELTQIRSGAPKGSKEKTGCPEAPSGERTRREKKRVRVRGKRERERDARKLVG